MLTLNTNLYILIKIYKLYREEKCTCRNEFEKINKKDNITGRCIKNSEYI